jgi:hypothetical protein
MTVIKKSEVSEEEIGQGVGGKKVWM